MGPFFFLLYKSCQIFGITWPKRQKPWKKYWRIFFFFCQDEFAPEHVVTEPDRGGTRGEELRELSAEEHQCENFDKNRHKKSQQHGPKGNSRIELSFPLIRSVLCKKQRMDEGVRSFERQMRNSLNAWTLDASLLEMKVEIIELNNRNSLNILSENTTILVLFVEIYVKLVNCLEESLWMLWMNWCQWLELNILMDKRWRIKEGLLNHPHS